MHTNKLSVSFKIIILWENLSTNKLLLKRTNIIQKVFRLPATDVIDCIWRYW